MGTSVMNGNENDELALTFEVTLESYAHWINAYYAIGRNQMYINNIKIVQ